MWKIILALLVLFPETKPNRVQVGMATTFYPKEKGMNNGILGCTGEKWKNPDQPFCASRTIPCGTWVHVENVKTKDTTWCKVMDRGPYGKYDADGKWFNAATDRKAAKKEGRERRAGTYRAKLDMSRSVAKKLKSKGMVKVKIRWWRDNPLSSELDKLLK
mgnify:CR=1 FL=1